MKKYIVLLSVLFFVGFCFCQESLQGSISDNALENELENENLVQTEISSNQAVAKKFLAPDFNFMIYMPSWPGNVTGSGSCLQFREDASAVTKSFASMAEFRSSFVDLWHFSFAWSSGINSYFEMEASDQNLYSFLGLSLGLGTFFHFTDDWKSSLAGMYLFFYPVYSLPVLPFNSGNGDFKFAYSENDFNWKCALDFGTTFVLLNFSVSAYSRYVFAWTDLQSLGSIEFGFTVGYYAHRKGYYETLLNRASLY